LPKTAESKPAESTIARSPAAAYDRQDELLAAAFSVLQAAIAERAFPAASVAITLHGNLIARKTFGRFTYEAEAPLVQPESIFDLASVSKVVATTAMAMLLHQGGNLDLAAPVGLIVPEFLKSGGEARRAVTLRMLLAHSSGLPAHEKFYLRVKTREELLAAAFQTPLVAEPGSRAEYSDIGFIILGIALERLGGEGLASFCRREIFAPLGMIQTDFTPAAAERPQIPPTADDRTFRHRIIQGEVQDENASVLGGIAGHAGVFATADDVSRFAQALLQGTAGTFLSQTVSLFTKRETTPAGTSRALGWDTPSAPSQSGKYFSSSSFGHLGYTGTSLWIDPERQLSITLLTNRTWPDCKNQAIKEIRPRFHDAVIESLGLTGDASRQKV
jgi:CubicO group peptidase (beta-lactamase class C family)